MRHKSLRRFIRSTGQGSGHANELFIRVIHAKTYGLLIAHLCKCNEFYNEFFISLTCILTIAHEILTSKKILIQRLCSILFDAITAEVAGLSSTTLVRNDNGTLDLFCSARGHDAHRIACKCAKHVT